MAETLLQESIHPDDPDDEWITSANRGRAFRVRVVTGVLVLLLVLAGGFWGGVVAEKHHGSGPAASASLASRIAAARAAAGATGAGGGPAFGGAGGSLTTGTVIDVQGDVVAISDSSGNIVKIEVGPATSVTRTARTGVSGIQIGDTVVVSGSGSSGATMKATAVRATAQGAGTGGGTFRGGLGAASGG